MIYALRADMTVAWRIYWFDGRASYGKLASSGPEVLYRRDLRRSEAC